MNFIQDLETLVKEKDLAYEKWSIYHLDPNNYSLE